MDDAELMKEYISRAKSLALNLQYHDIEVNEQEISRRVLNGLSLSYAAEKRNFTLRTYFRLSELEDGLVRVEELNRTGPAAAMPWPLASKPEAAGEAGDVETTMTMDAASVTVNVARRISGSHNISRGISESSPRISRNNSSISHGTSESSPRISSNINSGTSNISDRSRNSSTRHISRDISRSSQHSIQGNGVHHAFVSGVVNTGVFCQNAVQYPPRVFLTRTRARKLLLVHILKTTPILGAVLCHHSQPPRRRIRRDRPFCPSPPRAPSPNRSLWRNVRPPPPGCETITIEDRRKIKVDYIGNMDMIFHGKTDQRITMIDVAYVPGLGFNLYSLHAAQRTHLIVSDASGTHSTGANLTFPRNSSGSYLRSTRLPAKTVGARRRQGDMRATNLLRQLRHLIPAPPQEIFPRKSMCATGLHDSNVPGVDTVLEPTPCPPLSSVLGEIQFVRKTPSRPECRIGTPLAAAALTPGPLKHGKEVEINHLHVFLTHAHASVLEATAKQHGTRLTGEFV